MKLWVEWESMLSVFEFVPRIVDAICRIIGSIIQRILREIGGWQRQVEIEEIEEMIEW